MKRILLACLLLLAAFNARAASPEETRLIQLSDDFDAAVAAQNGARLGALLHPGYCYAEPEPTSPPADATLEGRIAHRLSRDKCWSDESPAVRIVGDTAIVMGTYRVLEPSGQPRLVAQGRFTATWVKSGDTWLLLAEHRSLNAGLTWASAATPPARQPPALAAAPAVPSHAPPAVQEKKKTNDPDNEESRVHRGLLPKTFTNLFRAYEPNQLGYTWDKGDDPFLDFTLSVMFPLLPGQEYPDPVRHYIEKDFFRSSDYGKPNVYFASALRAGQYIGTRPSSPVVGKRFNPLLAVRFWARNDHYGAESEDNFLELVYGHESNGQFIASKGRFDEQLQVYLNQYKDATSPADADIARRTAYRSARDNISRGWDYVGVQFARDWDSSLPWTGTRDVTMAVRARFNYYLPRGLAQGEAEEYNAWEADPEGKARKYVDGLSLRYTLTVAPEHKASGKSGWFDNFLKFERRYALTWTTGYVEPFRFNTVKAEASILLFNELPLTVWYRLGYNSDIIDYYRKDHSAGLSLSFWDF
jgi:hypothetical protein